MQYVSVTVYSQYMVNTWCHCVQSVYGKHMVSVCTVSIW